MTLNANVYTVQAESIIQNRQAQALKVACSTLNANKSISSLIYFYITSCHFNNK